MAGDWIKMTTNLHENPHVVEMAEILDVDELHVVGMLWRVWAWADAQTMSGTGINTTERRINKMVGRDGFCDAMRQVGWIAGEDRSLSFTNFDEHNGITAKKRALGRNRNQTYRNGKGCDADNSETEISRDAESAVIEKPCDAENVTPVTQNESLEKRREEKNISSIVKETGTLPFAESSNYDRPQTIAEVEQFMSGLIVRPLGEELSRCALKFFSDYKPTKSWKKAAKAYAEVWAANNRSKDPDWKASHRPKDANSGRSYK